VQDRYVEFTLSDEVWGDIKILRPIPLPDEPWGILAPLKSTLWKDLIPVVSGEVFSHATHGHLTPLVRVIGPPPEALLRLIPKKYRVCASFRGCLAADKKVCHPCLEVPECYMAPGLSDDDAMLASLVILAWKEGRYVVIVDGDEFV